LGATTAGGITPVVQVKGPIGDGAPGPTTDALQTRFWAMMDEVSPLIVPITW